MKTPRRPARLPKCKVLHPFCQAVCCRTLKVPIESREVRKFANVAEDGSRILPRVTVNEDKFPGGEQVCMHWDPATWECSLKAKKRKAPNVCEQFSCVDRPGMWNDIEHNVMKMELGEPLIYPLLEEGVLVTDKDIRAARREVDRLNTIRRRELLKDAKGKADRIRDGSDVPF